MAGFLSVVGSVRRSQGIFTFGIGSIVDLRKGSFMPLGLKHMEWQWSTLPAEDQDEITLHEPRLQRLLGVQAFRSYPTPGEHEVSGFGEKVKKPWSIPCTRFPEWLECPTCNRLGREGDPFELAPDGFVNCTPCARGTTPVRFVVACRRHHIADFPWIEWAHGSSPRCDRPILKLKSHGQSAALADLYVVCTCGATAGLGEIFKPGALTRWTCLGNRPWLLLGTDCSQPLQTLQRGASNVHFGVTASMLSIPPASDAVARILERHWGVLKHIPEVALESTLQGILKDQMVDSDAALSWIKRRKTADADPGGESEVSCRHQEYQSLALKAEAEPHAILKPDFENHPFRLPTEGQAWFDLASSVSRLREVRALCGFTRIKDVSVNAEGIREQVAKGTIAALSLQSEGWLPAVQVKGEGIFLRLAEARVRSWSQTDTGAGERAGRMNAIITAECDERGMPVPFTITPRLLLLHGLAHTLLRRLSLDCGYSSASLRERLYVSEGEGAVAPMAGCLIYTASPDSDGSLGGLVSLATPDRLADLILRGLQDLRWCGSDPVCIETDPALMGERHSGAACHSCLLVPETACERFNRELDRAVLVGTPDGSVGGFFREYPGLF